MKTIDTKSVIIGLLFGVCVMLLMGQAKNKAKPDMTGVHDVITTKLLSIVNNKGQTVGLWGSDKDSTKGGLAIMQTTHFIL